MAKLLTRGADFPFINIFKFIVKSVTCIMPKGSAGGFYAVKSGRRPGVYLTWPECQEQVRGYGKARFKKFPTLKEAEDFITGNNSSSADTSGSKAASSKYTTLQTVGNPAADTGALSMTELVQVKALSRKLCDTTSLLEEHIIDSSAFIRSLRIKPATVMNERAAGVLQSLDEVLLRAQGQVVILKELISQSKVQAQKLTDSNHKRPSEVEGSASLSSSPTKRLKTDRLNHKIVEVYTDGCCHDNGRGNPRGGIGVFWGDNDPNNLAEKLTGRQTNNRAEIHAARKAILQAKSMGYDKIVINTDSMFTINCITKWILKWKKNGWTLANGQPVINRRDLEKLDEAMIGISVEWKYVKGHAGVYGNEMADRLANEGASLPYTPQPGDSDSDEDD